MSLRIGYHPLIYFALIIGAVIMVLPFAYLVGTSLMPGLYILPMPPTFIPDHPTLQNYIDVWTSEDFGQYFLNSTVVASISTAITVFFSAMVSFTFARYSFPGRTILFYGMLLTLMLPALVLIIPQFILAKDLHLLNSLQGLIAVYSAAIPLNVFMLRGFFEDIPVEIGDAAVIDGASMWRLFWGVMLPLARPAVAAVTIFTFLANWDEFTWALTSIDDNNLFTLPVGLQMFNQQHGTQYGLLFAGSVIAVLPVLLVFVLLQRHFIKGVMAAAVKG